MRLEKKQSLAKEVHEKFEEAKIVIVTDYKGLDVASINDLRGKLREANVEYKVVKNTLLARASEETGVEAIKEHFKGPNAIALSYDDPVAPAKVLTDFAKDNEKLEIKIGVMDGNVLELSAIKALSSLPSREVLLAQMLSAMNGVPTAMVRVLNAVPQNLMNALNAIKEQKEKAAA